MEEINVKFEELIEKYNALCGHGHGYKTQEGFNGKIFMSDGNEDRFFRILRNEILLKDSKIIMNETDIKSIGEAFKSLYRKAKYKNNYINFEKDLKKIIPSEKLLKVLEIDKKSLEHSNMEYYVCINKAYVLCTDNYYILIMSGWND